MNQCVGLRADRAGLLLTSMQVEINSEAAALHERLFTIDTHLDTPTASLPRAGWDFGARHDYALDGTQCDLPRMVSGGLDAVVFAVYFMQGARTSAGHALAHAMVCEILKNTRAVITAHGARCGLASSAEDALRLKAEGKRAIFLSTENAYSLGTDLAALRTFYELGVRMVGFTHMLNNEVADSSTDPRGAEWGGLSPFGRAVVVECNRLGIVLDASHTSDAALEQMIELSRAPVILSHSGCRAVCDHPRNIGDDLLRQLAARDGVIQINALPVAMVRRADNELLSAAVDAIMTQFRDAVLTPVVRAEVSKAWRAFEGKFPQPQASMHDYVDHVLHAVRVAGVDHVGIGCDLDGGGGFEGLRDVASYPAITQALLAAGLKAADLAKIWGGNTLRVFRAAELARAVA
ncbi:MAG: dipeptidase [Opitutaceae bacterium]